MTEFESKITTTLAPMLLAIGTFSLTVVGLQQSPSSTVADEVFAFLGVFSLFGSALIIDWALDEEQYEFIDRLTFLGGGYLIFCIVLGGMSAAIPILYETKRLANVLWQGEYILFIFSGISFAAKLMQRKEKVWTAAMFVLFAFSVYFLWQ